MSILLIFGLVFTNQAMAQNTNTNENTNTNVNLNTNTNANANKVSRWDEELAEITDPGILPDSPIFILKTWWEDVQMFFYF